MLSHGPIYHSDIKSYCYSIWCPVSLHLWLISVKIIAFFPPLLLSKNTILSACSRRLTTVTPLRRLPHTLEMHPGGHTHCSLASICRHNLLLLFHREIEPRGIFCHLVFH